LVSPYLNLLNSDLAVVVLTVSDVGGVSVAPFPEKKPEVAETQPEPIVKVEPPVLEATEAVVVEPVKPKRKRKKQ
jgi:hypothetical protein